MKKLKFIFAIILLAGSTLAVFSQPGLDSVNNNYKNGINQNPTMKDNQDKNISNPSQRPAYDKDITSPGQNSSTDYKLNKEDSVTLYKKGGTLINTDTSSQYPVNGPSNKSYSGTPKTP